MRYLLDTHTLLWHARDASNLPPRLRRLLNTDDGSVQLVVSVVSLQEIVIKLALQKLELRGGMSALFARMEQYAMERLAIQDTHLQAYIRLPFLADHRDPFDRLLLAQAQAESLTLVSRDPKMRRYDGVAVVWA